ncbi:MULTISPECIES: cysteine hydrolase family protein [Inquilinus]|uniref:Nicotinamidase-related amidase n=1 Tax=Inquilinus ginsengisoli TaxID=363840 RepID=A0ABU1JQA0_9PROT|nr:cysteine hydrolase [Inquilinus ginsengisoli]MDR6290797.1 nicotinamidase-related amidase [Inquilinus ginsengisoli]
MTPDEALPFGRLGDGTVHLCIDMQELFAQQTPWHVPWAQRTSPSVRRLVRHRPADTIFTRFLPPRHSDELPGSWRRYYTRWAEMTRGMLDPRLLALVPMLAEFVPPALVFDKHGYSAFTAPGLGERLRAGAIDTLILSGGETDICVLATALGAVDRGYRLVLAEDAVCSTSDTTHEDLLRLFHERFSQQIEVAPVDQILEAWP